MSIFPHVHFNISYPLPMKNAFETASRINIKILDRDYNAIAYGENGCEILFYPESKRAFFHNPFLPIIRMTYIEQERGTVINLNSRLRSRAALFLSVIIFFGVILEAGILTLCISRNIPMRAYLLIPVLCVGAVYIISSLILFLLSKSFLKQYKKECHM